LAKKNTAARKKIGAKMFIILADHDPPSPNTIRPRLIVTCPSDETIVSALDNARHCFANYNYIPYYLADKNPSPIKCLIFLELPTNSSDEVMKTKLAEKVLGPNPTAAQCQIFCRVLKQMFSWRSKFLCQERP